MSKIKLTEAQALCLSTLKAKPGHKFSGFSSRTLKALEKKGMIENLVCSPSYDPCRGYSRSFYTASITNLGKGYTPKGSENEY